MDALWDSVGNNGFTGLGITCRHNHHAINAKAQWANGLIKAGLKPALGIGLSLVDGV